MPGLTKARLEEIHAAARQLVAAVGGVAALDAMADLEARRSVLVGLAKQLTANEGITYKTARLHIAKACRRMRTPTHQSQPPNWGGARDGAGRKATMTDEMKTFIRSNTTNVADLAALHEMETATDPRYARSVERDLIDRYQESFNTTQRESDFDAAMGKDFGK